MTSYYPAIDFHCHLHDARNVERLDEILENCFNHSVNKVWCCTSDPDDLDRLVEFIHAVKKRNKIAKSPERKVEIFASFGIHPWYAEKVNSNDEYLKSLSKRLEEIPYAGVGEIGLCNSFKGKLVSSKIQEEVFLKQLSLASSLKRPTTIHCVGLFGRLFQLLASQTELPPVIILHSYGSSFEMMESFLRLGKKSYTHFYFSYSARQIFNNGSRKGAFECFLRTPLDNLLLETDSPDQLPHVDFLSQYEELQLKDINEPFLVQYAMIEAARQKEIPVEDLSISLQKNQSMLLSWFDNSNTGSIKE